MDERARRPRTLAAALICVTTMVGCAGPDDSRAAAPTTTPKPTAEEIAWVNGECAVEAALAENPLPPRIGPQLTEADRPAAIAFVTVARDRFRSVKTVLDGLGAAPVPDGDDLVAAQKKAVNEMVGKLDDYVTYTTMFPTPDFGAPFRLAAHDLNHFTPGDLSFGDLTRKHPVLAEARSMAPDC